MRKNPDTILREHGFYMLVQVNTRLGGIEWMYDYEGNTYRVPERHVTGNVPQRKNQ